jgi:LDH2 family malate/lactate/ureidoglycolate dehydrogenase
VKTPILKKEIIKIFQKYGLSKDHALISANALINAELVGAYGHGLSRLKMYCDRISKKVINPKPKIKIKKISQSISHIDANNSIGFVAADLGIKTAIKHAQKTGIGMVAVKNSGHYGLSGYYAEQAVKKNLISNDLYQCTTSSCSTWCFKKFIWHKPSLLWNTYWFKSSFYFRYIYLCD